MTRLLPWNQPFLPIRISARVNKRLALQRVSNRKGFSHAFFIRMLFLIYSGPMWGLESFHSPESSLSCL